MGIFKYFKKRAMYNQTRRSLKQLTNRELKDIGISRSDIDNISRSLMNKVQ